MLLQNAGVEAAVITADTPGKERAEILEKFEDGVINALCNVAVLTEGWDAPRTDCIALLRPTKSLGLYVQICGRGMRTWGDKKDCLLLDYGENIDRHGCIDKAAPSTKPDTDEPKIWVCDAMTPSGNPCLFVNDWIDKKCVECGADKPKGAAPPERKEPEVATSRTAAQGSVLSDEMSGSFKEVEKIKEVEFTRAARKKSKSGNEYLNVEFKLVDEYWPQNMPFMIGMNGPAGIMAKKKWKACAVGGTPVPYTISQGEELINEHGVFNHIQRITVRKEGRYWNVVSVYY